MVQVDVFWTFALGASFAASAARQLEKDDKPFQSPFFVKNLLYLSILFVPSGATLLWGFPEWETMQAGSYSTIPAWLVMLFSVTNITQGILGYWVALKFIKSGKLYLAHLMWVLGYFIMFFILVHGWDGLGYQRFFYLCTGWSGDQCVAWNPGSYGVFRWLVSPVALTLYAFGVVMLPLLFYWMSDWMKRGYELADVDRERAMAATRWGLAKIVLRVVFIYTLGGVIFCSILIHYLGWMLGLGLFAAVAWFVLIRRGGLIHRDISSLTLTDL